MKIGVLREVAPRERRVALIPDGVAQLTGGGATVVVEEGAGKRAFYPDDAYRDAGAELISEASQVLGTCDIIVKVERPTLEEAQALRQGSVLVTFFQPQRDLELVEALAQRPVTTFSMDLVPRITRAQSMDALSSMSTIAGYKAVLRAASSLGKMMPMLVTAAGTLRPARVLILGAGVAGLQAIATARRLGAVVEAFDVRPVVKEQVESLGARFVEAPKIESAEDAGGYARELDEDEQKRNLDTIAGAIANADIAISTALIPGRPAPTLITEEMVQSMKPGSVIVDLATETGGNCVLTEAGKEVVQHGVVIIGPVNIASTAATHASQMYCKNVLTFLSHIMPENELQLDLEDPITGAMCITHDGQVVHGATRDLLGAQTREGTP